jgi:ADP-ribose pyrophosphatase YjhB (NUDIX family)
MTDRGTVTIVFYTIDDNKQLYVLLGEETQFLCDLEDETYFHFTNFADIYRDLNIARLADVETTCDPNPDVVFGQTAHYLTEHFQNRGTPLFIMYQSITSTINARGVCEYHTHFRFVKPDTVPRICGVVKGGIEPNEKIEDCIIREVFEETHFKVNGMKLQLIEDNVNMPQFHGSLLHIYSYYIPYYDTEAFLDTINKTIREKHRGEMHNFRFVPFDEKTSIKLNQKSYWSLAIARRKLVKEMTPGTWSSSSGSSSGASANGISWRRRRNDKKFKC